MSPTRADRFAARPKLTICPLTPKAKGLPSAATLGPQAPRTPTTPSPTSTAPTPSSSDDGRGALRAPSTRSTSVGSTRPPASPRQFFASAPRHGTFVEVGPAESRGDLVYADFSFVELGEGREAQYWVYVWSVRTLQSTDYYVEPARRDEFAACVLSNFLCSTGKRTNEEDQRPLRLGGSTFALDARGRERAR